MNKAIKHLISCILIGLIPCFSIGQVKNQKGSIGLGINASINGEFNQVCLGPNILYSKGKRQFELGLAFNPFSNQNEEILGAAFTFKYYPSNRDRKFNAYLLTGFGFTHNSRNYYFPSVYNYISLNAGYGIEISLSPKAYLGSSVSLAAFSYNKESENPSIAFSKQSFFEEYGFSPLIQVSVGYLF